MPKFVEQRPSYSSKKFPKIVDNTALDKKDGAIAKQRCKQCYFFNEVNKAACAFCGSLMWK